MHIPDGILPFSVCAVGYGLTLGTTWFSLKKINEKEDPRKEIPKASLGTAAFFVASFIHIPVPIGSVHLVLTGLLGAMLGFYAFPAILISLFLQAALFGHGGLTTLGVNAVMMGIPAIICYYIYKSGENFIEKSKFKQGLLGFTVGSLGVLISVVFFFIVVLNFVPASFDVETEKVALQAMVYSHIPLMFLEGIFTAFMIIYLKKVKPEILEND